MKSTRLSRQTQIRKITRISEDSDLLDLTNAHTDFYDILHSLDDLASEDLRHFGNMDAAPYGFADDRDVLIWLSALVLESPTGHALLKYALEKGWNVGLGNLANNGFHLDLTNKAIVLDNFALSANGLGRSTYFRNTLLINFIKALRDIWQENHLGHLTRSYKPEAALMLERMRAADCDTVCVLAAWELRGAGYSDVWRTLLGSEEGDMAIIFSKFLERDPSALYSGKVMIQAFRTWFADSTRISTTDHETLNMMDDIITSSDTSKVFGRKDLHSDMIERISHLPNGICYLEDCGNTILRDPFFSSLNDSINEAHLFQIKYDLEVTVINNVPFQDSRLGRKIFPSDRIENF